ncbi:MAG: phosphoribosylformylglycinamidine cyclo-ligase [Methanobrevibacter sp.]|jgi:phosphoribosylformylglycinamidine cyclo-ligase|nr:phosphoribosylformylglycinamidine cyclo-ligase [Candidatus Methanoflexus mossambicus]
MVLYSDSGVDISLEEKTVSNIASILKSTLKNQEIITESGHFAALVKLGNNAIAMSTDGVGSKILIAEMMKKYDTVGIDCIAMVVNDILCVGAEPIALVDYLAVEKPDIEIAGEIAKGLVKGANLSNIAIIGGETASIPDVVKGFDLAGTGIGIVDIDKIISGENIADGDVLIGLKSTGIHSNGLSLARKAIFDIAKLSLDDKVLTSENTVGEELLKPTEIYVKAINDLLKKDFEIKGLAHITGGGVNNLKRLNKNVGFEIDNFPQPQDIFKLIHDTGVPIEEMYAVFNMGIGFIIIVKENEADSIVEFLNKYHNAYKIGKVNSNKGKINIKTYTDEIIKY